MLVLTGCEGLFDLDIVESVVVSPDTATISVGEPIALSAVLRDSEGNELRDEPDWRSADPAVVEVDDSGRAIGRAVGITLVEAWADGESDVAHIRVVPLVSTVALSADDLTLTVGEMSELSVTLRDRLGNATAGESVTWRSTNPTVAAVSSGRVQGLAQGAALIVAEVGGAADTARVLVLPRVTAVTVRPDTATMAPGESIQLDGSLLDHTRSHVSEVAPSWRSSDPHIVSVTPHGRVTAENVGVARVIASYGDLADTATVRVVALVSSLAVTPKTVTLGVGEAFLMGISGRDYRGRVLGAVTPAWTSADTAIAVVDAGGTVRARAPGVARIIATVGLVADTAQVRVVPLIGSVTVRPDAATLEIGDSIPLTAVARDYAGRVIAGVSTTWISNAPSVATVSSTGEVRAIGVGTARIIATADEVSGAATVTVEP